MKEVANAVEAAAGRPFARVIARAAPATRPMAYDARARARARDKSSWTPERSKTPRACATLGHGTRTRSRPLHGDVVVQLRARLRCSAGWTSCAAGASRLGIEEWPKSPSHDWIEAGEPLGAFLVMLAIIPDCPQDRRRRHAARLLRLGPSEREW